MLMITQMKVADLKTILDRDPTAVLIDVREVPEFEEVRAKRAQLVPLSGFSMEKVLQLGAKKDSPLYLICRSGGRSMQAAQALERAGFTQLVNIEGGTMAWVASGFEISQG